jgi:hypothetical protein
MEVVYLAAQYERKEEMRHYRNALNALGVRVSSRWIASNDQIEGLDAETLAEEHWMGTAQALLDIEDVRSADTFIMFTSGLGRGGHHTEFGMAMAMGKNIILIGKRENVFHCLSWIQVFPNWEAFMKVVRV